MKICCYCKIEKDLLEFYRSKNTSDGLASVCKVCAKESAAKWNKENKDKLKAGRIRRLGGVRINAPRLEFHSLLELDSPTVCTICLTKPSVGLTLDHYPETLVVRGVLCKKCRAGLYLFGNNIQVLQSAISYLEAAAFVKDQRSAV